MFLIMGFEWLSADHLKLLSPTSKMGKHLFSLRQHLSIKGQLY